MTLDIRGSVKNTKVSSNAFVVFDEMISNSIDAFLIRRHSDDTVEDMQVNIEVSFEKADLVGDIETMRIVCQDNGCGLGDEQLKAFLTKDTSYKDDLDVSGIGRCKGAGRIQYFHHFSKVGIVSRYKSSGDFFQRSIQYAEPQKKIDFEDVKTESTSASDIGLCITLSGLKDAVVSRINQGELLSHIFSASALKQRALVTFLQRLVGLKARLGNFAIKFQTHHWYHGDATEILRRDDLPPVTTSKPIKLQERNPISGEAIERTQIFLISHYKLDAAHYSLPKNAVALCANSSPVKDITSRYLRTRAEQNNPVSDFYHIVLIESEFFDGRVNEQRDDFEDIPEEIPSDLIFSANISYQDIYDHIDPIIGEMVAPSDWTREEVITDLSERFGVSEAMLKDTSTRITYGDNAQTVVERVLKKYQERIINDTSAIVELKDQIVRMNPYGDDFRAKINELSWKYTASLKNYDMANLSQLIVRRAAIVEVLALACTQKLDVQEKAAGERRNDESIIHSIFFPMRKDSTQIRDHDIWLLNEEYNYYDYIASDLPLASIKWQGHEDLFDGDIDEQFADLLNKRNDENKNKRPDIAIFSDEGSAIIIEFKSPGVPMDDHVADLVEYSFLLASKSKGKLTKFYCYLIGDTLNPLRLTGNWTPFPMGDGRFLSSELIDPVTRRKVGDMYAEILYFNDVVSRAQKRIGIYQDKLRLNLQDQ